MDRRIDQVQLQQEKRKRYLKIAAITSAIILTGGLIVHNFSPSVEAAHVDLTVVERRAMNITISASGKVVPASEQVINSPISSTILEVLKNPGDSVQVGESIIRLDLQNVETELANLVDQREMQVLGLEQLKLRNANTIAQIKMDLNIQNIEQKQREEDLRNEIYLDSIGVGTPEKVRQMRLQVRLGEMRMKENEAKMEREIALIASQERGKSLEIRMLEKDIEQKKDQIKLAQIRAPKTAILSFVNQEIGTQISQGSKIATISDLSAYKLEGTISSSYSNRFSVGSRAIVEVDDTQIEGSITYINPVANNQMTSFAVSLPEESGKLLRSGLQADIYIVESEIPNTLFIPTISSYTGEGYYELFVLESGSIVRRDVRLGKSNFEGIQVLDGLSTGESVVTSSTKEFKNYREVKLK